MIEYQTVPDTNIIELTLDGKISKEEFDKVLAKMQMAIDQHGKVRVLEHIRSFGGMPLSKFWDDLKFGFQHANDISHAAVVTDKRWIATLTTFAKPFVAAEVRYFHAEAIEQARQWLSAPS